MRLLDLLNFGGSQPREPLNTERKRLYACPCCGAEGINGCGHQFEVLCFPYSDWRGTFVEQSPAVNA
jgi:hypothetical protein